MASAQESTAISLPRISVETAQRLAAKENRTVEDWIQSLIAKQDRDATWNELLEYGLETGRASGYTEEDVVRLVHEVRDEIARERAQE